MLFRFLLIVSLTACSSSKPTPYQKEKKQEGYRDEAFEELKISRFRGNSYTNKDKAQRYAEFRAIEICSETDKKHANIIDIFDKTIQKEITRSSGTGWGPSYFGMYPYYSRYSSIGFGAGFNTISSNSWSETLVYPLIEVYYTCSDKVFRPQLIMKEISAEDMKHLVKDVKGAVQVEKVHEDSPNKSSLETGDIILKANGKRIEKVFELIRMFTDASNEVTVQVLREGERVISKLRGKDITAEVEAAEKDIISKVCKDKDKQENLRNVKLCN